MSLQVVALVVGVVSAVAGVVAQQAQAKAQRKRFEAEEQRQIAAINQQRQLLEREQQDSLINDASTKEALDKALNQGNFTNVENIDRLSEEGVESFRSVLGDQSPANIIGSQSGGNLSDAYVSRLATSNTKAIEEAAELARLLGRVEAPSFLQGNRDFLTGTAGLDNNVNNFLTRQRRNIYNVPQPQLAPFNPSSTPSLVAAGLGGASQLTNALAANQGGNTAAQQAAVGSALGPSSSSAVGLSYLR